MANTPSLSLFISSMLFLMLGSTITGDPVAYSCTYLSYANHTSNSSKYLANLDLLLQSLSYNANATSGTGFYNTTIGDGSDKVYGLFLCRGDLTSNDCQTCIETASAEIKPICPNNTAAVAYYDKCMLRYANQSIFSVLQQEPFLQALAPNNFTKLDKYNQTVADLLHRLVNQAVNGSFAVTPKHYAAGEEIYYTGFDTIYGLVQCTPDITSNECNNCLTGSVNLDVPKLIYPRQGGRILKPSCNIRFEFNSPFYEIVASPPATPPSTNSSITPGKGRNSTKVITILAVANGVTFIMVVIIFILYRRVQRRKLKAEDGDDVIDITSVDFIQFNFDTIKAATDNFSDDNKLGEGGFGAVYKGNLSNGQTVAVKRLSRNSVQGEIEFKNEVKLAAKLQHRNLVRILGFCYKGLEKLIVYEFVPNKSLDRYIFDPSESSQLNWEDRYNIIEGIARGILYLHEDSRLKIIHRDLKASNILLDEEMNPKIADFGMARLFIADQSQSHTNRVVGTYGYMAPEYVTHGQVSVKTDVYSFGVLLLEIVSGQRNNSLNQLAGSSEENLLNHAWRKWREGEALSLVDPNLGEHYNRSEVIRCIHIGLLCIQEDVSNRPTMATVVLMLNSYSVSLPQPASSASQMGSNLNLYEFSADSSRLTESSQSTEPSEGKSINKMSITDLSPR